MYSMLYEERKKWTGVVASGGVEGEWNSKKHDKGRCPLCLGEEDVKRILLDCLETSNLG